MHLLRQQQIKKQKQPAGIQNQEARRDNAEGGNAPSAYCFRFLASAPLLLAPCFLLAVAGNCRTLWKHKCPPHYDMRSTRLRRGIVSVVLAMAVLPVGSIINRGSCANRRTSPNCCEGLLLRFRKAEDWLSRPSAVTIRCESALSCAPTERDLHESIIYVMKYL